MTTPKHTPTPWGIGKASPDIPAQATIRDENGNGWDVAHCFGHLAEANAELIVRAVNSHAQLRDALGLALRQLERLGDAPARDFVEQHWDTDAEAAVVAARAALEGTR